MKDIYAEYKEERRRVKLQTVEILRNYGMELHIGSCGYCNSPWITFKHNGGIIVNEMDEFHISEEHYK